MGLDVPPDAEATTNKQDRPLPGWLAVALVVGTSAAVLVLEILAGRLLAPYVGCSFETYTGDHRHRARRHRGRRLVGRCRSPTGSTRVD